MTAEGAARPALLVLASTYPRWLGDPEPGFVHELCKRLTGTFRVIAVVPSAPGALPREDLEGVEVRRFRYAPRRLETLVNDGGIVANLRRSPWKLLLVPGFVLGQWLAALRVLRQVEVGAVHAHWLIPQGLIALLLGRRVPYLVTSHGADLYALRGRLLTRLKARIARRAAALSVVSAAMVEELAALGVDAGKVRVLPMGVDLHDRFTPAPVEERSAGEILFVGRLVEKKGLRHLIEALPAVRAACPGAHLSVAGFGPEEQALRQQVAQLGLEAAVRFLGPVPQQDLPALYRRAAVFAAPFVQAASGDREGLGLVVIEALGCGCPVLVSDLPATRDAVADPACRVAPGDAQALAQALIGVLQQPERARQKAQALRATALERFDWASVADRYAALLSQLAQGPGHRP